MFSKDISLGNLITLVTVLASIILGYGRLETRISVLESADQAFEKSREANLAERNRQQNELRGDLRELRQDVKTLGTSVLQAQLAATAATAASAGKRSKE